MYHFLKKIDKILVDARVQEKLPSHRVSHSQQREAVIFYSCLQWLYNLGIEVSRDALFIELGLYFSFRDSLASSGHC